MATEFQVMGEDGPRRITRSQLKQLIASVTGGWKIDDEARRCAILTIKQVMLDQKCSSRDRLNASKALHKIDMSTIDAAKVALAGVVSGAFTFDMDEAEVAAAQQSNVVESDGVRLIQSQKTEDQRFREMVDSCETLEELEAIERVAARQSQRKL